ncbi:hypothetical protein ACWC5I_33475, partial [Kitasatospora sp. NPDC001574]
SVVAAHLLEAGHRVTVLDDLSTGFRAGVPSGPVAGPSGCTGRPVRRRTDRIRPRYGRVLRGEVPPG